MKASVESTAAMVSGQTMKTLQIEVKSDARARPSVHATINPASIAGLGACIEDAKLAAIDNDPGPVEPHTYEPLLARLEAVRTKLPPLYRDAMLAPFMDTLHQMGEQSFK